MHVAGELSMTRLSVCLSHETLKSVCTKTVYGQSLLNCSGYEVTWEIRVPTNYSRRWW